MATTAKGRTGESTQAYDKNLEFIPDFCCGAE